MTASGAGGRPTIPFPVALGRLGIGVVSPAWAASKSARAPPTRATLPRSRARHRHAHINPIQLLCSDDNNAARLKRCLGLRLSRVHPAVRSARSAPGSQSLLPLPPRPILQMGRALPALLLALALALCLAAADPPERERSALIALLSSTPHERALNWSTSLPACSWTGVRCDAATSNSTVTELHLPGIGLVGRVPRGPLSQLPNLQVLSLRDNRLDGPVPPDVLLLPRLKALYLQRNRLSGAVPTGLAAGALPDLEHLALSGNDLSGPLPDGLLAGMPRLRALFLDGNRLSGSLAAIGGGGGARLEAFNVSFNDLAGPIPASLARFQPAAFAGNPGLCGTPLADRPCSPAPPSPSPGSSPAPGEDKKAKKRKLSGAAVVAIAVGSGAAALLLLLLLAVCLSHRRRRRHSAASASGDAKGSTPPTRGLTPSTPSGDFGTGGDYTSSSKDISAAAAAAGAGGAAERSRLVFVGKQVRYSFDLEDLLRASAEVLGKGALGTSYKAVLEDGATVVVKRLKDVAAARREFGACVESAAAAAGECRNLVPMRGYYYSKDEKLLVLDFLPGGSLSARLHGSRGTGRTPMDWEARTRAALCAARGLAHLHTAHGLAHGNIKSSNLLLRPDPDAAALSDYCLHQLFPPAPVRPAGAAGGGYRAPELTDARRPTLPSDVYALGVLLLELLTGRSPATHAASLDAGGGGGGGALLDLPRWVQSVVREEWTAEVFDAELVRAGSGAAEEEEMVALLQVAMACVSTAPDARPDARDVVGMLEEVVGIGGRATTEESRGASEEERSRGPTP